MKVDLCIWTKNGSKTLPVVLERIEQVFPHENVRRKIAVDDSSVDDTVVMLKEFNWSVYDNVDGFINGGTKEALRHVQTRFFVSIEQDVLLSRNWWNTIPHHMEDEKVAVAQGVEISTNRSERAIEELVLKKMGQWFSIGNNIYRTAIIQRLGFTDDPIAMDSFYRKIVENSFRWIVDRTVISTHLHPNGILNAVFRNKRLYNLREVHCYLDDLSLFRYCIGILASPLKAFSLTLKSKEPRLQLFYPLSKLALIPTYFKRRCVRYGS